MKYQSKPATTDWLVNALKVKTNPVVPQKTPVREYYISSPFSNWDEMWGHR